MPLLNWIHISDIHIKGDQDRLAKFDSKVVLDALWKDISNRSNIDYRLKKLDFAFITGDLSYSGSEYSEVYERIIKELIRNTGIDNDHIFIVPGNHDTVRSKVTDDVKKTEELITSDISQIKKFFLFPEDISRKKIFSRLESYQTFVKEKFPHIPINKFGSYAVDVQLENNSKLRIVGLNSSLLAYGGEEDRKKMILGEPIMRDLYQSSLSTILTISLVHHPLKSNTDWFNDIDLKAKDYVLQNSDITLCGHVHKPSFLTSMDLHGEHIEIISGSIFDEREWSSNSYNYVIYDTDKGTGDCFLRRYNDDAGQGRFQTDITSTPSDESGKVTITLRKKTSNSYDRDTIKQQVSDFLNNQERDLNKRPLLSEFPAREAISFLVPDLYIDSPIRPRKSPENGLTFSKWIKKRFKENMKVLILGPPGIGKTTTLIHFHHNIKRKFASNKSVLIPLFYESRNYNWGNNLDISIIIDVINSNYSDTEFLKNFLNNNSDYILFPLIDAFDEAFPNVDQKYEKLNLSNLIINFPHIATCRLDFFNRNLDYKSFTTQYDEIIEIDEWHLDREATSFLHKYMAKINTPNIEKVIEEIKGYLSFSMPLNPLTVTAFLFLWREDKENLIADPITSYGDLLKRFTRLWASVSPHRVNVAPPGKSTSGLAPAL
ncbi:MAG: metallophosphoesterase [Thermodesulfobacteriota bacterium]